MRGRRNALGALVLAGAAYAWQHRDELRQQWERVRDQLAPRQPEQRQPAALPDLSATEIRDFSVRPEETVRGNGAQQRYEQR